MSGFRVITPRGEVDVPQDVEAQGAAAIEVYVNGQITQAAGAPRPIETTPPSPAEGDEA